MNTEPLDLIDAQHKLTYSLWKHRRNLCAASTIRQDVALNLLR